MWNTSCTNKICFTQDKTNEQNLHLRRLYCIRPEIDISEPFIPKGIGHEFTLETDVTDIDELNRQLFILSDMTAKRLRKQNKYAKVICVILKDNFFKRYSHQKKLLNATNITSEIYDIAKNILKEFYKGEKIRLIGLRLADLVSTNTYQTSLEIHFDSTRQLYSRSQIHLPN